MEKLCDVVEFNAVKPATNSASWHTTDLLRASKTGTHTYNEQHTITVCERDRNSAARLINVGDILRACRHVSRQSTRWHKENPVQTWQGQ